MCEYNVYMLYMYNVPTPSHKGKCLTFNKLYIYIYINIYYIFNICIYSILKALNHGII